MDTTLKAYVNCDSATTLIANQSLGREIRLDAEDVDGVRTFSIDGEVLAPLRKESDESEEQFDRRCLMVRAAIAYTVERVGQLTA